MKLKVAFAAMLLAGAAHAQTAVDSNSSATTASTAGANNAGNAQQITFNNAGDQHYSGSYTARTTGQAVVSGFAGSFSSDYCGGTAGLAVGGPGFSVSGGAPKMDDTCRFLRVFERIEQAATSDSEHAAQLRAAALDVLAEIDPKVRDIFTRRGLIQRPDPSKSVNAEGQTVYSVAQTGK
ncbi:hypothetical protein AB6809_29590 [Paraburkholderia sp. RCC_158]|uniref:hypothetical protein n=1 Tax=Paraburkholderia sp. RCC_158 TaxID=3239220 RepID=UPI00352545DE